MNFNDLQIICRLCLIKPEHYEDAAAVSDGILKEKLKLFFQIDVDMDEKYSTLICMCCLQTIQKFCEFYDQVLVNQDVLRRQTQQIHIEKQRLAEACARDDIGFNPVDEKFDRSQSCFHNSDNDNHGDYEAANDDQDDIEQESNTHRKETNLKEEEHCKDGSTTDLDDEIGGDHGSTKSRGARKTKKIARQTKTNYDELIREFMPLVCDQCPRKQIYDTFKELTDHYETVHKCRGYITCCDKKIYRKDVLVSHITNHIDPEAYKCNECGKISKSKTLLQIHMKIHLPVDKREFQCCICTQRFATKSHLANHEISHLPDSEKKFSCDECGKAFGVKNALTKHKLIHSAERNFVCEDCGRSFAMKANLQYHINNMHSNEPRPKLQCHICQAWFKNNDTLRKHIRQHNDQTEYKCEHCDKVCSSRNVLWCHVRFVHKKIRKHECNVCERKFRRKYELTDHMAKHTGQPLYKCQNCSRSFMYSSYFSQHRKKCVAAAAADETCNTGNMFDGEF